MAGVDPQKAITEMEQDTGELSAELQEFIDQLIVPLLVERFLNDTGHLYRADRSYYDDEPGLAQAA